MDWWILIAIAVVAFFAWKQKRYLDGQKIVKARLERDKRLLQHIKMAKREYEFSKRDQPSQIHKNGELLYETAHYSVFNVTHFAESRLGFHFKDIEEYGLYGFFAGGPGEYYDSYYRSDASFKIEGRLAFGAED